MRIGNATNSNSDLVTEFQIFTVNLFAKYIISNIGIHAKNFALGNLFALQTVQFVQCSKCTLWVKENKYSYSYSYSIHLNRIALTCRRIKLCLRHIVYFVYLFKFAKKENKISILYSSMLISASRRNTVEWNLKKSCQHVLSINFIRCCARRKTKCWKAKDKKELSEMQKIQSSEM